MPLESVAAAEAEDALGEPPGADAIAGPSTEPPAESPAAQAEEVLTEPPEAGALAGSPAEPLAESAPGEEAQAE